MKIAIAAVLLLAIGAHAQCKNGVRQGPSKAVMECIPEPTFFHWREVLRDGSGPWIVTYSDGANVMVCNEAYREGYRTQAVATSCVLLPNSSKNRK